MTYNPEKHKVPLFRQIYSQPALVVMQYCYPRLSLWCSTLLRLAPLRKFVLPSLAKISHKIHMVQGKSMQLYPQGHQVNLPSHYISWSFSPGCTSYLSSETRRQEKQTKRNGKKKMLIIRWLSFKTREVKIIKTLAIVRQKTNGLDEGVHVGRAAEWWGKLTRDA